MKVVLYTTHCPRCKVLEIKLKQKHIEYTECEDIEEMMLLGIKAAPILGIDDKLLDFGEAVKWINALEA